MNYKYTITTPNNIYNLTSEIELSDEYIEQYLNDQGDSNPKSLSVVCEYIEV